MPNAIFYNTGIATQKHCTVFETEKSMAKNDCFETSPEKATIAYLPGDALKQLKIPSPCSEEQKEIADFLDKKCNAIDNAVRAKQKIIDRLIAYKNSLIYETVTGKKEI